MNPIITQDTCKKKWTSRLSPKGCFYFPFLDVLFFTHWILSLSQTSRSGNGSNCLRMIYQDSHRSCVSWESYKIICKLVKKKKLWLVAPTSQVSSMFYGHVFHCWCYESCMSTSENRESQQHVWERSDLYGRSCGGVNCLIHTLLKVWVSRFSYGFFDVCSPLQWV